MKLNAEITQLIFNIKTLEWKLDITVRGENNRISITAIEASSLINSFNMREEENNLDIETNKDSLYYIPKPLK